MLEKLDLSSLGAPSGRSYDPGILAKLKADTYNAISGTLTGWDCPKCRNRGTIAMAGEDGRITVRDCDCMATRRCVWEMEKSGLKNSIREKTFDAFDAREDWQKTVKAGALRYAQDPKGWLLLCGQSGSGKTHLCTAVCRQRLLAGDPVRYMPWREKTAQLKAMALDNEQRAALLDGYKRARILYVDDLYKTGRSPDGTANPTGADIGLAFEIFNYRYNNGLPTIISTERTPQELVEIDEATGSRIAQMCGKHIYAIRRDPKRNYRLREVMDL